MKEPRDAYKVLQVDPEADVEVIQAAYRRLAQKYHPDRADAEPDAAARMVEINGAWDVLRDTTRRADYDRRRASLADASLAAAVAAATTAAAPGRPAAGPATDLTGSAGPPPGRPSGSVLNFGRYAGWSLGEIGRSDPGYLEWLDRTPIGRPYRDELDGLFRKLGIRGAGITDVSDRAGAVRRR